MKAFTLSRSKIELFMQCPRCFYNDVKCQIKRPPGFPFSLNNAVDILLKREFDMYRENGTAHPLQQPLGLIPANHPQLQTWRNAKTGVSFFHPHHQCRYYGGIDDLWFNPTLNIYHVVDYKATAKTEAVTELPEWTISYKRQIELYQWLLRQNGLHLSDTAYFLYCTGDPSYSTFNGTMHFRQHVIAYHGQTDWIEDALEALQACYNSSTPPPYSTNCAYCNFKNA